PDFDRERVDFTDYTPDPSLEDEFFGGFKAPATSDQAADAVWRKTATGWRRRVEPSPWNRVWGRIDIDRGRLARQVAPKRWADDGLWGWVDGQTPEFYQFLKTCGRWPDWRKIKPQKATSNQVVFPFAQQAIRLAEQTLPESPIPESAFEQPEDRPFTPRGIL